MSDERRIIYLEERVKELEELANCRWSNDPLTHLAIGLRSHQLEECGCRVCTYDLAQRVALRQTMEPAGV